MSSKSWNLMYQSEAPVLSRCAVEGCGGVDSRTSSARKVSATVILIDNCLSKLGNGWISQSVGYYWLLL